MVLAHNIHEGNRTCDVQIVQNVTFDTMLLTSNTLQGLTKSGFYRPSPVQLQGIPLGKCGFDLLLEAKSGTGKTAVFTVIALEKLDLEKGLQTVILAPTREIASQICDVVKQIGSLYEGLCVEVVMGGLPVEEDISKFKRNVHVVVGSPGRLRHLIQDNYIDVSSVRLLVLDEADRLMEKSFQADINYIFTVLPTQKQVIMSSATYPENTKGFINKYVKCAQHVCPDTNCVLLGVEQKRTVVKCNSNIVRQTRYRFEELLGILTKRQFKQCLIFCNYQARVAELYKLLTREKWPVEQLCGQQEQTDRLDALKTLKEYKCRILVSTDLAARGIDASNVDLVINFEPPHEWQTYLHRIGRAGRYGSYGMSISILSEGKEEVRFNKMLEAINLDISKVGDLWTTDEAVNKNNTANFPQSHVNPRNNLRITGLDGICKDVWHNLIEKPNSKEEELEDFDSLCKSFEEANQPKFECFTDLVTSFENNKDNMTTNKSTFIINHSKTKSQAMKTFFKSMNALKDCNDNDHTESLIEKKKECDSNLPDISYTGHIEEIELKTSNASIPELKVSDNQKVIKLPCMERLDKNDKKKRLDTFKTTQENYDLSCTKALRDAGLPTSFGMSKYCYYNNKNKTIKKTPSFNVETNKKDYITNKHSSSKNIDTKIELSHPRTTKSMHNVTSHYTPVNKTEENLKKGRSVSMSTNSGIHQDKVFSQPLYSETYVNWYYNLKNRVKQIELAFYIDELSKL